MITITARDAAGNQGSAILTVTYSNVPPAISILSPTSTGTFTTSSASLNVSGSASDSTGITQVSWSCDRCGSGVAAGTTSWSISGIALQAGVNVITITARDAAGNQASATLTVTSDAIPPAVAIVSPTASGIFLASNASFTVSGNASDNIGVTQVSWSCDRCGSGVAQGTSAWSISGIILQAGINVITVTAADGTGNHATATLTVTYDGVPPAIAIVSPTAAGTYAASIANLTLSGSSSDNIGVVQVSWSCDLCGSGVAVGTTAWSINGISLSPGVNVITVTARDGAGNQASAALRVTFSTIPPSIVISSPTSGAAYSTANSSLNISGSASGPAGVSQVAWNCDRCGTGVASGTTSWSVSGIALQSGVNVITVTARDAAGNPSSATLTVNYDNVPPAIAIVSPTARGAYFTNSATLVLAGTSSDSFGVTQVTWQCDRCGSGTAVGTTNWSVSGITLQSGANAITVSASDAAGNKTSSSLTVTFDNVAPSIAIASPTAAASYLTSKGTLNISGTSSDNMGVTQVAWSCDRCGSGVASGTQSWSVAGIALQQGINVISVTASDAAGNRGSATLTVTYSSTPPTIAIAQPTTAGTYYTSSASVNISGTSADNTGVLQVAWSCDRCGSGVASGTTSWSVSGILLQTGANAISIIATDSAGNQAIATLTVIYITTPPNVALTSPTSAGTYSTSSASLNIAGTASNLYGVTQVTWQCDRCGSGVASGTSNWSVNGISLQPGGNTITVFASDVAGNRGSYMLVVTLIIYTPSVQSLSPLTSTGANQVYTFQYSDTAGAADLNVMNVLINSGLDGRHACYIAYVQQYNTLFLVNDAGDAGGPFAGSIVLGGSGSVNNSQCTIAAAGSTAFASGNTLTLTLNMSFSSSFGGNKVVYLAARDSVNNSGWQTMGTHGVPPLPSTFPMPGGMSPASGSAASSTLSFMFNDASSANNLQTGWALINTAIDGRAACYLAYFRPGNQVYLFPDNGDGSQAINMTLSGTNTLSNSQCTISSQGSSVTSSGAQLTVNLNITFNHSFAGPKGVWMADQTLGGLQTSAWQVMGVWKVP